MATRKPPTPEQIARWDAEELADHPQHPYIIAEAVDAEHRVAYVASLAPIEHLKATDRILRWPS